MAKHLALEPKEQSVVAMAAKIRAEIGFVTQSTGNTDSATSKGAKANEVHAEEEGAPTAPRKEKGNTLHAGRNTPVDHATRHTVRRPGTHPTQARASTKERANTATAAESEAGAHTTEAVAGARADARTAGHRAIARANDERARTQPTKAAVHHCAENTCAEETSSAITAASATSRTTHSTKRTQCSRWSNDSTANKAHTPAPTARAPQEPGTRKCTHHGARPGVAPGSDEHCRHCSARAHDRHEH